MTLDLEAFAAALSEGLADVGTIRVEGPQADAAVFIEVRDDSGDVREYCFAQSLSEIAAAITIDEEARRSMWPGWSLTAASIAMFSVHVQEAIAMAPSGVALLRLVPHGVVST